MTPAATRVLLVEDNPEDAEFAQSVLSRDQPPEFDVRLARTCREAVDRLKDQAADVILLDLSLPDGRGLEVVSAIREVAERAAIVVLTGADDVGLAETCLDAGAQDYLDKDAIDGRSLRRAIGYSVHRLQGELRRNVATLLTGYRTLSSQATSGAADSPPPGARDPARFAVLTDAYTDLLNRYVEAASLHGPRPRTEIERIVTAIGECDGGPQDLIDVHLAALERTAARAPETRVRVLTAEGRLMALEMMGILVEYYRNACHAGDRALP